MALDFAQTRRTTVRAQLMWGLVPTVLVVIFVTAFASYTLALKFASQAYDAALFDSARSLAQQLRFDARGAPVLTLPEAAQEILVSDPYDRIFYRVLGADRQTVAGNADIPLPPNALTPDNLVMFYDANLAGQRVRVSAYAVFDGSEQPEATVLFAETLVKRGRLSQELLLTLILPLVMVTIVVTALVWYGVEHGLAPLNQLASALSRRGWSDLSAVGSARVPGEVRPLVESLDNLMTRLAAAHDAQQRFISEAAHQLRTPLAGLAAQVERALASQDINAMKPALGQIESSSRRVTRLVNQLLTLARAEPGSDPQHELVPLDLSKLVQETCREWVPQALEHGVDLGFVGVTEPLIVVGHEMLLAEMLNNLIDNALRYGARKGGTITVRLTAEPTPVLSVEDDGAGIPESERERIFERFHRVSGSPPGGSGLGLAIVREIARLHGASVRVDVPASCYGAMFSVVFREAPQKDSRKRA